MNRPGFRPRPSCRLIYTPLSGDDLDQCGHDDEAYDVEDQSCRDNERYRTEVPRVRGAAWP